MSKRDTTKLVRQLREEQCRYPCGGGMRTCLCGLMDDAADALEVQARELAELRQQNTDLLATVQAAWWRVLGVAETATRDEVEAAYRRLAAERHPDKPGGSNAMMAELNRARDEALRSRP